MENQDKNCAGTANPGNDKRPSHIRLWILLSVCFLVLIAAVVFFVQNRGSDAVQPREVTLTDVGFDTPVTFSATCTEDEFNAYLKVVIATFVENNQRFDQYNEYEGLNNVYTLNQEAYDSPVEVDDILIDLLQEAAADQEKNSVFDITEGKLTGLWHDAREAETPYVPSQEAIDEAKQHEGISALVIEGNQVSFTDPNLQLDLGGIAKGYTAEIAAERLQAMGLDNGYINAGGNVVLLGEKADGSDWVIGIQAPDLSGSVVQLVTAEPVVMVTSGDYQRYFEVDGVRYSHIIDPTTGYPVQYMRSVTVIGTDSSDADAQSTTLFGMELKASMEYASENGIEAVWITDKGQDTGVTPDYVTDLYDVYVSDGLKDSIRLTEVNGSV